MLPSLIALILVLAVPLVYSLVTSFFDTNLKYAGLGEFLGLQNYIEVLKDTYFIDSVVTTVKFTFFVVVIEFLVGLAIALLLNLLLAGILALCHTWLGDWMILAFAVVVFGFSLLISFLYPIFSRIGNKFTPLEDGELKDKLVGLLTKHGYQVKAIEVMDASRRTTKLNAYFTGFGKMKTIVLFDNLVNAATPEEICAVFAHELGHGLHKDVLKQQVMNFGNLLIMAAVVWLAVREPALHEAFGFSQVNYGLAYVLLGVGLALVQPITGMAMSAYSRFAEYRADRQTVEEGYGEALVTGLKKLAKENCADLAPNKALVVLEYSHPPLSQRIEAIEKELKK
jgi:STE24 endopeptidase